MTKDCDCMAQKPHALVEDIGVLASTDPVAIDQATLDLTNQKAKQNLAKLAYPHTDPSIQINYAEKLGLGSKNYDIIEVNF